MTVTKTILSPQKGFQVKFLSSPADIVIGGGAAGGGKTYGLLMELARNIGVNGFGATVFRRTSPQITMQGGLWDTALKIYPNFPTQAKPKIKTISKEFVFPQGSSIKFAHLQHEKDKYNYDGSQIPLIGFDELIHFTESQFWYMLTRNRSTCGVKPYVRAVTNPQGKGWVKRLIAWWIYPDDYEIETLRGFPIPERDGVLRYFTRISGKYYWGSSKQEVLEHVKNKGIDDIDSIKSLTFIKGDLADNKILLAIDKGYKANLLAQDDEVVTRLLKGRWLVPTSDELRMYLDDAIRDLFTNDFIAAGKDRYITADIALEGSDRFIVCVWYGWRVEQITILEKSDGKVVLDTIKRLAKKHHIPTRHITYDKDGVGGYLKGFLRTAIPFVNGGATIKIDKLNQNYANLKTQCYYLLRDFINESKMYINTNGFYDKNGYISSDKDIQHIIDLIIEELEAIEKVETGKDDKLKMIDKGSIKAILGRSPDFADTFAMRCIFELKPKKGFSIK